MIVRIALATNTLRRRIAGCVLDFALLLAFAACSNGSTVSSSPTAPPTSTSQAIPANALVIINGLIIDGSGAVPIPDGLVALQGNRIVAVGPKGYFAIPAEANVIDAKGGTILPGIINAHVHSTADPATRRFSFLLKGVTATCDLGAPMESISQFEQEDASGPSARGFRAGPIITAPDGYPDILGLGNRLSYEVSNPFDARAAVVELVNRGVDAIKVALEPGPPGISWPVLSPEEVKAIAEEAHARGMLVRAHVTRADQLDIALDARVDVIEHIPMPLLAEADWKAMIQDGDHLKLPDAYEAQLKRMIKQQVVMVPTLSVTPAVCNTNWYKMAPEYQPLCGKLFLEVVRRFHALGGMVVLGNDYGNPGVDPGMPILEMQSLIQAGLTPMEVIRAETSRAAIVCGHGKELGTLEVGKLADLIVVDGNPLTDLEAMSKLVVVIKDGEAIFTQR